MDDFKPFENDSQALSFPSGEDELSLENGKDAIVLSGTLTIAKGDQDSRQSVLVLRDALSEILKSL